MSDTDPIVFRPRHAGTGDLATAASSSDAISQASLSQASVSQANLSQTSFNRHELTAILDLYGRKVAAGAWRDYSIDLMREKAVFSVFRKASEFPLYSIVKEPRQARRQGAYRVVAAGGMIMKRGHDLKRVLGVLEDRLDLVTRATR